MTDATPASPTLPFAAPGVAFSGSDAARISETTLEYGWYSPVDRVMVPIADDVAWDDAGLGDATRDALHAWEPIDAILVAHSFDPEATPLAPAVAFARSWLHLGLDPIAPDMGVAGRRSLRLAYLAEASGDDGLAAAARRHAAALAAAVDPADTSLSTTDAIAAVLTFGGRGMAADVDDVESAERLLHTHLAAAFTPDGVHRSQSPGIQRDVIERLRLLLQSGHTTHPDVVEARRRAEHTLAWFVGPDGRLANFGDTTETLISGAYDPSPSGVRFLPNHIDDPALLHAASLGRFGSAPEASRRIFHEGGFVVIKEPWPIRSEEPAPASHFVLRTGPPAGGGGVDAGLAFTWHEGGRALIVEPGPQPHRAAHPAAMYPATPAAHNRVVVGPPGEDDTEPAMPDGATGPLTGGLQRWGVMEGYYFIDAYESTADVRHRRSVLFEPGSWLVIADAIDVAGTRPVGPRFHSSELLDVVAVGDRFAIVAGFEPVAWAVPLAPQAAVAPQRGALEPVPGGWCSPDGYRMVPNWVFGWDAEGPSTFVTLLAVGERPEVDEPQGPWFGWHTPRYRARVAVTEWGIVDIDVRLTVEEES